MQTDLLRFCMLRLLLRCFGGFFFQVFSYLHKNSPESLQRLVPIEGDISQPGLGISNEDLQSITDNVSVIFHLAATIKFNEHLRKSLLLNVVGVREIVQLARKAKNLQVSTSNCVR